jgi:hypothetical protein
MKDLPLEADRILTQRIPLWALGVKKLIILPRDERVDQALARPPA